MKRLYNILITVAHLIGISIIYGLCATRFFGFSDGTWNQVYDLYGGICVTAIMVMHYGIIFWAQKNNQLRIVSVWVLLIVEILLFGQLFLVSFLFSIPSLLTNFLSFFQVTFPINAICVVIIISRVLCLKKIKDKGTVPLPPDDPAD